MSWDSERSTQPVLLKAKEASDNNSSKEQQISKWENNTNIFLARSFVNHCSHFQATVNTQLYYNVHNNLKWTV